MEGTHQYNSADVHAQTKWCTRIVVSQHDRTGKGGGGRMGWPPKGCLWSWCLQVTQGQTWPDGVDTCYQLDLTLRNATGNMLPNVRVIVEPCDGASYVKSWNCNEAWEGRRCAGRGGAGPCGVDDGRALRGEACGRLDGCGGTSGLLAGWVGCAALQIVLALPRLGAASGRPRPWRERGVGSGAQAQQPCGLHGPAVVGGSFPADPMRRPSSQLPPDQLLSTPSWTAGPTSRA